MWKCLRQLRSSVASALIMCMIATSVCLPSISAEAGTKERLATYLALKATGKAAKGAAKRELSKGLAKAEADRRSSKMAQSKVRDYVAEMTSPLSNRRNPTLSQKAVDEAKAKAQARTLTQEEYRSIQSDKRFSERRREGVRQMWVEERARLMRGEPGTRDWSPQQRQDILNRKTPLGPDGKPMEGHHMYSAQEYPKLADNPRNMVGTTKNEHVNRWHGGDTRIPTHGAPRNPKVPNDF